MNLEIIPAIIPKNVEDAQKHLSLVYGLVPVVQIDILDGKFVPDTSYPYGAQNEAHFRKVLDGEESFPFIDQFYMEADLMIKNPEQDIDKFAFAGFKRVILHVESTENLDEAIARAREFDLEAGIAINIDTPSRELDRYVDRVDFVQFMGIARIGFQGESFDERVVEKIRNFRSEYSDIIISVDGGVNLKNAAHLLGAGADRLVAGSVIFKNDDIAGVIDNFNLITRS